MAGPFANRGDASIAQPTEEHAGAMAGERIKSWVKAFVARKKRAPRILHVGNIANNAYLNARVLRDFGIENHVLCNDLYHVNSNPEWFDSGGTDIERSQLGEDFFPNFWAAGVDDRVRPRWFAQGSMFMSLHYLRLLCDRDPLTDLAWDALDYERFRAAWARTPTPQNVFLDDAAFAAAATASRLPDHTRARFAKVRAFAPALARMWETLTDFNGEAAMRAVSLPFSIAYIDTMAQHCADKAAFENWRRMRAEGLTAALGWELADSKSWKAPARPMEISREDAAPYLPMLGHWDALFSRYDHLIFYADQPMLGALTYRRYLAYEHGTIRSIPFDNSAQGRLTTAGYLRAAGVFITNIDYIVAKRRLEFKPGRIHYIPHAFDERPLLKFRADNPHLKPDPHVTMFFWPTRQDWVSRDPRMSKENDVAIRAAALARRRTDKPFRIVAIAWGVDLEASKALIEELGMSDCFEWIGILNKSALWSWYLRAHCVIDQFTVSTVNGVTSESLMLGRPTMCIDDGVCVRQAYGESAPYLAGGTPEQLAERFLQVINDPLDTAGIGAKSADWALRKHSAAAICDIIADGLAQAPNARLAPTLLEQARATSEEWGSAIPDWINRVETERLEAEAKAPLIRASRTAKRGSLTSYRRNFRSSAERKRAPVEAPSSAPSDLMDWPTLIGRVSGFGLSHSVASARALFYQSVNLTWDMVDSSADLIHKRGRKEPEPEAQPAIDTVLHFGADAESLTDKRQPAPAELDWRAALVAGFSLRVRLNALKKPIGAVVPGGVYVIYWDQAKRVWVGIGPNGDMPNPTGGFGVAAAECPSDMDPSQAGFILWGVEFWFEADGLVRHYEDIVGRLE